MRTCIALMAVLGMTAVASGEAHVWFTVDGVGAIDTTPTVVVDTYTDPLVHIEVWIQANMPGFNSFSLCIDEGPVPGYGPYCPGEIFCDTVNAPGIPGWTTAAYYSPHPYGYADLIFFQCFVGAPVMGQWMVLEFDVEKFDIVGFNGLYAGPGTWWTWGIADDVIWGGNGSGPVGYSASDQLMAIIECTPEPATIALLDLGVVGLLHRR